MLILYLLAKKKKIHLGLLCGPLIAVYLTSKYFELTFVTLIGDNSADL